MGYAHKVVLIFIFLTALSAPAFTADTATDLISHAKKLSDLRAEGAAPFHLGIVFTLNGSLSKSHGDSPGIGDGSFVETWVSPTEWRSDLVVAGFHRTQVANGKRMWTLDTGDAELPDNIENVGFFLNQGRYESDEWKSAKIQDRGINSIPVKCLQPKADARGGKSVLCFYQSTGELAVAVFPKYISNHVVDHTCVYSDYGPFGNKTFPHSIRCFVDKRPVLEENVAILDTVSSPDPGIFRPLPDGRESVNCPVGVTPPKIVDAPDPRNYGRITNTTTVFRVAVRADGTVTNVKLIHSGGQRFDEAAKQAVLQWKFRPASCGDEPIEVPINVEVSNRIR
jgi:TonB family protein